MRILVAEDEPSMREMLRRVLEQWGYEVTVVSDGLEALDVLRRPDAPRLAILDWIMPGLEAPDICRQIRRHERDQYTYIILLTIKDSKNEVVEGINSGADDYITKPFDPDELRARLGAVERKLRLNEELLAAQRTIRKEAMRDPLTGLQNRAAILDALRRELDRAKREHAPVGVVMVDLDRFKAVNDLHGHLAGDEVLREVAQRMACGVRSFDSVGRFGGDEFLIVFPHCGMDESFALAERLRKSVAQNQIPWAGQAVHLTISAGAAGTDDASSVEIDRLIYAADMALYAAKRAGRNCTRAAESLTLAGPAAGRAAPVAH